MHPSDDAVGAIGFDRRALAIFELTSFDVFVPVLLDHRWVSRQQPANQIEALPAWVFPRCPYAKPLPDEVVTLGGSRICKAPALRTTRRGQTPSQFGVSTVHAGQGATAQLIPRDPLAVERPVTNHASEVRACGRMTAVGADLVLAVLVATALPDRRPLSDSGVVAAHRDLVSRARAFEECRHVAITADPVEPERINSVKHRRRPEVLRASSQPGRQ
jgi:hypothetical protein